MEEEVQARERAAAPQRSPFSCYCHQLHPSNTCRVVEQPKERRRVLNPADVMSASEGDIKADTVVPRPNATIAMIVITSVSAPRDLRLWVAQTRKSTSLKEVDHIPQRPLLLLHSGRILSKSFCFKQPKLWYSTQITLSAPSVSGWSRTVVVSNLTSESGAFTTTQGEQNMSMDGGSQVCEVVVLVCCSRVVE